MIDFSSQAVMDASTDPYALVVDDDPLIQMDACDILQDAGFRCYYGDTGQEAVELLGDHAQSVTLMFSDVEMPGEMDGFALARRAMRIGRTSRL